MSALALSTETLHRIEVRSHQVSRSLKRGFSLRIFLENFLAFLTLKANLKKQIDLQGEFLRDMRLENYSQWPDQSLLDISKRLYEIVARNTATLVVARDFPGYWREQLSTIAHQQAALESLAESLALSASPEFRSEVDSLLAEPFDATETENWRDFVGTLSNRH